MRSSMRALTPHASERGMRPQPSRVLLAAVLCACGTKVSEPEPTTPPPPINDGSATVAVAPPRTSTADSLETPATGALCTESQRRARWAAMDDADIVLPRRYAGLDLAGGDTWNMLTLDGAEQVLCASQACPPDLAGSAC